jgi:4'-phosphopantetheinyl transferase
LRFGRTASGKPFLELPQRHRIPRFNLSHCRDLICLAATDGCELGIDVEVLRPMPDCRAIARHTFTDVEMNAVECAARPNVEFFRIWTCREAVGKAIGTGLSGSPLSISAGCADGRTTSWCEVNGNGRRRRFQVFNIGDDSHAAALAVETEGAVRIDPVVFNPAELLESPGRSGR